MRICTARSKVRRTARETRSALLWRRGSRLRGMATVRTMATSRPMRKPRTVPVSAMSSVMPVPRRKSVPYFCSRNATQPKKDVEAVGMVDSL